MCDVEILDYDFRAELNDPSSTGFVKTFEAALNNQKHVPKPPSEPTRPASLLTRVAALRCSHFGWVGLFDRRFVERHLHDESGVMGPDNQLTPQQRKWVRANIDSSLVDYVTRDEHDQVTQRLDDLIVKVASPHAMTIGDLIKFFISLWKKPSS